ncbi:MAG: RNA-binding transcriptional accessory protein [Eubacterium sp.]|nr:RNA-binding transcriptional accessory protein [Eubacterium sp.]
MNIAEIISSELNIKPAQANAAIKLLDEGCTVPFIARYRKEATGALNDEQLRSLFERLSYLRNLEERKAAVLAQIDEQGLLSSELKKAINAAETLTEVEDLYLPYKPKRRTRATIAKEKGLEPLSLLILAQNKNTDILKAAEEYISKEKGVESADEAISGAMDILAEVFADNAKCRSAVRDMTFSKGRIVTKAKDAEAKTVYEMYYDFDEAVKTIAPHRVLAINRGEKEKVLSVKIDIDEAPLLGYMEKEIIKQPSNEVRKILTATIADSYKRLLAPAIERDIRSALTESAEDGAIKVFGKNLSQLLMQPPISGHKVLGWDPAFRTGCKLAVIDETGRLLDHTVVFPTEPQNKIAETKKTVLSLIKKYGITLISCGNGTASRESEKIIADIIKDCPTKVSYIITNEAGASVYSASKEGTAEFPNEDVGTRSAASIARRAVDPLAELVKIDPKSIGVGQYQHDMDQKKLGNSLEAVVEDCVNKVGVDLNTASAALLSYISGINKTIASNIVSYREEHGSFSSRKELLKVAKLGPKAYEQCAGFLRIPGGKNPLDNTSVHPESYKAAEDLLKTLGFDMKDIAGESLKGLSKKADVKTLSNDLGIGELTLKDIISELEKPGRDPRKDAPSPVLRSDVLDITDLSEGMILKGTVRNVIDFGAFVDIGVHHDGLVHISQLSDKYIKHPLEVVSVGDIVEVKVLSADPKTNKISLSMKGI